MNDYFKITKLNNKTRIDDVTLIISTSSIPSHPDNSIIKSAIENTYKINYDFYDVIIAYDKPKKNNANYNRYIDNMMNEYPNYKHIRISKHGHFIGNMYNALKHCKTKYFLVVQHDIKLVGNFPVKEVLNYKFDWNIIATHHKKEGLHEATHWFPIIENYNKSLLKTYGWSERIFMGKTQFFIDKIYEIDKNNLSNKFIESVFHKQFTKLFKKLDNINSYKYLNPYSKNRKIYDKYWNDWKCFNLKSHICYHEHLHGRTKNN